jgi:hypothetical protein
MLGPAIKSLAGCVGIVLASTVCGAAAHGEGNLVFGACCDLDTGVCVDVAGPTQCSETFYAEQTCAGLDPPCGNPGCCCDYPEPGIVTAPQITLEAECDGRFIMGVPSEYCTADAFWPPCGLWAPTGMLYAPSDTDNAGFRAAVAALIGAPVDYFDARMGTPTVEQMRGYQCVMTHVNYGYADSVGMGDQLADYVDVGGRVILGHWCYPGAGNHLDGRIMTTDYCPAVIGCCGGTYNGDGTDCVHDGVATYAAYDVVVALQPGAESDGTVGTEGKSAVAWRGDRRVYYSCGNSGSAFGGDWVQLTVNMLVCGSPPTGACCELQTGVCVDTSPSACDDTFYGQICAVLEPPCGNPGACCNDATGVCVDDVLEYACAGRAVSGTLCIDIVPRCGGMVSVLYAPSNSDNPTFRSALAALVGGPVDYVDTRTVTPTLEQLLQYDCVFTWSNYPYADRWGFGNALADYVDVGGKVILGQWAYLGLSNYPGSLYSRILDPAYCPVEYHSWSSGTYAGDGVACVHSGVVEYASDYVDVVSLWPGSQSDGTFDGGNLAVAWRPDRKVYYSPGNTGGSFSTGDWVRLTANMCTCPVSHITGDLNCDGAINAFDIDPFVLALTSHTGYAAQFPYCDYMLADCNGDGLVNAFDIDPFVALLVGAP